ncbi:hypothetical protein DPEC_G00368400, partial [Dallia pectoralis]
EQQRAAIESAVHNLVDSITQIQSGSPGPSGIPRVSRPPAASGLPKGPNGQPTVHQEMQRSFPAMFRRDRPRGKRRFPEQPRVIAGKQVTLQFYLMPENTDRTPKASEELSLLQAGLGRRVILMAEDACHSEINTLLEEVYPKMSELSESEGYSGKLLKTASSNGKHTLYIVPLQDRIDTSPLSPDASEFAKMPKSTCKRCNVSMPLQLLALHIETCVLDDNAVQSSEPDLICLEEDEDMTMATCPVCKQDFADHQIESHASSCGESLFSETEMEFTEQRNSIGTTSVGQASGAWKGIADPAKAVVLFRSLLLCQKEQENVLRFSMDIQMDVDEQDRAIICFYKSNKVDWARPLHCKLQGDAAVGEGVNRHFFSTTMHKLQNGFKINFGNTMITMLFEGQSDHLIPSTSQILVESDLFLMAGRMMGHSFIHGGPCLSGLSPAIIHVLLGNTSDTATIQLEDIPDLDLRETIKTVEGNNELTEREKDVITELALSWDLPGVTDTNRKWLFYRLLQHAVLGRTLRQVKQLRRGIKETNVWPVLTERADVAPIMFPRSSNIMCSPEHPLTT